MSDLPAPEHFPDRSVVIAVYKDGSVLTSPGEPLPTLSDGAFERLADAYTQLARSHIWARAVDQGKPR